MSNTLIHKDRFPGAQPDNGHTNEVGPNAWLKEHVFQGGTDGALLVWDSAQSDKVSWTTTPALTRLGVGGVCGSVDGPALNLRSVVAGLSDHNSPLIVQCPADYSLGGDKVNFFINPIGNVYMNTSLNIVGNHAYMGTIDGSGNFVLNGDPRGNVDLASMLDIYSDTNLCAAWRVSSAFGAYAIQQKDAHGNFVFSILNDGTLSFGLSDVMLSTPDHAHEDTTLGRIAAGTLLLKGDTTPGLYLGNSATDAAILNYTANGLQIRRISGASVTSVLDVATIQPADTVDFSVKQNGVLAFQVIQAGAIAETLVAKAARVGVNTGAPGAALHVVDGAGNLLVGNNGFGNDWIVINPDVNVGAGNFALAVGLSGHQTILNAPGATGKVSLTANNSELAHFTSSEIKMLLAAIGTVDPHVSGQLWRSGLALQVSAG